MNKEFENKLVTYQANGEDVKISPAIIKNYLVAGNGAVTDREVVQFLNLCRFQKLNPFLREAYLVKYGNADASIVTSIDLLKKRAFRNEHFKGYKAGIIALAENGTVTERIGTFKLPTEKIVGGWAKVETDNNGEFEMSVSMDEYIQKKKDGTVNSMWSSKPGTMVRKVALAHTLREAFPEELAQLYVSEEMPVSESDLSREVIEVDERPEEVIEVEVKEVDFNEL